MTHFTAEGVQFLRDLAANNDRDWFEARKQIYIEHLRDPALEFIQVLGERLKTLAPGVRYDTAANGSGSLMRINRDIRFSKDKSPYKTNIAILFWEGPGKKMEHPGFGFQFEATGGTAMGGMFNFDRDLLGHYREALVDDEKGGTLAEILTALPTGYTVNGQHYKRVPRGYDKHHPREALLRHNGLWVSSPPIPVDVMTSPDLVDVCYAHCEVTAPVQRWVAGLEGAV